MVSEENTPAVHRNDTGDDAEASVLTAAQALELCPKPFRLVAKAKGFSTMEDLSSLQDLDYIDVRDNKFWSLQGISRIQRLKTVILKGNCLSSVDDLGALSNIRVLNLAENKLSSLESIADSSFAAELVTLVVGGNQLRNIDAITAFPKLRTLVISNNRVEDLSPAAYLPELTKLSASHNAVQSVPPALAHLDKLEEFRLAHNKLTELPAKEVLENWGALRIIDLGHNGIENVSALSALAERLVAVNFAGNPVAAQGTSAYRKLLLDACPRIEIVDGVRLQGGRKKVRLARQMREDAAKQLNKAGMEDVEPRHEVDVAEDGNKPEKRAVQKPEEKTGKTRKAARKKQEVKIEDDGTQSASNALDAYASEKKLRKKRKLLSSEQQAKESNETGSVARTDSLDHTRTGSSHAPTTVKPRNEKKEKKKKKRKREKVDESSEDPKAAKTSDTIEQNEGVAAYPEDDDDALDASEFLKRASALKAKSGGSQPSHSNKVKGLGKIRKRSNRSNRKEKISLSFGGGGESQWD